MDLTLAAPTALVLSARTGSCSASLTLSAQMSGGGESPHERAGGIAEAQTERQPQRKMRHRDKARPFSSRERVLHPFAVQATLLHDHPRAARFTSLRSSPCMRCALTAVLCSPKAIRLTECRTKATTG